MLPLLPGLQIPSCIRDASPDAWGRRVLINMKFGLKGGQAAAIDLDELTCLLESGSDRIGALDFQRSATEYVPRQAQKVSLDELVRSVEKVEQGLPLTSKLDQALHHGSSIGGARPKALIEDGEIKYIAKFASAADIYSVVKAEFIAMRLAHLVGLNVAPVRLTTSAHKDVLLIERFDRVHSAAGWQRKAFVSALTLFGLDEMMARYASYADLAEIVRHRFVDAVETLRELYGRLVFNILCGNTDDHARNHGAFWDGWDLQLTPAYDICPQARTGQEATQSMLIAGQNHLSRVSSCLEAAAHFHLSREEALEMVRHQLACIIESWDSVCDEAGLSAVDRSYLWGRQFLNPFAFDDLDGDAIHLKTMADEARS
jgi:serine/threonine-protein kinase HipA